MLNTQKTCPKRCCLYNIHQTLFCDVTPWRLRGKRTLPVPTRNLRGRSPKWKAWLNETEPPSSGGATADLLLQLRIHCWSCTICNSVLWHWREKLEQINKTTKKTHKSCPFKEIVADIVFATKCFLYVSMSFNMLFFCHNCVMW